MERIVWLIALFSIPIVTTVEITVSMETALLCCCSATLISYYLHKKVMFSLELVWLLVGLSISNIPQKAKDGF